MKSLGLFVTGTVWLKPTASGGRRNAMGSGYPHQALLEGARELTRDDATRVAFHDCVIDLLDRETIEPSETAPCRVYAYHPEFWRDVRKGQQVGIYEGWRLVGALTVEAGLDATSLRAWLRHVTFSDAD